MVGAAVAVGEVVSVVVVVGAGVMGAAVADEGIEAAAVIGAVAGGIDIENRRAVSVDSDFKK